MCKTWDLKRKSCEGNGDTLLSKPSASETDSLMPAHHTRPTYDKRQWFQRARDWCSRRHVFKSWHWRDETEVVETAPFGYQTVESYLQNFVVVYSDPLHKEKVVCFGHDMTAWLSNHVARSHTRIQTEMVDKVQEVLERIWKGAKKKLRKSGIWAEHFSFSWQVRPWVWPQPWFNLRPWPWLGGIQSPTIDPVQRFATCATILLRPSTYIFGLPTNSCTHAISWQSHVCTVPSG